MHTNRLTTRRGGGGIFDALEADVVVVRSGDTPLYSSIQWLKRPLSMRTAMFLGRVHFEGESDLPTAIEIRYVEDEEKSMHTASIHHPGSTS